MKLSISKQQQLIESHNSEVKLELLDDIGLDLKWNDTMCVCFINTQNQGNI